MVDIQSLDVGSKSEELDDDIDLDEVEVYNFFCKFAIFILIVGGINSTILQFVNCSSVALSYPLFLFLPTYYVHLAGF